MKTMRIMVKKAIKIILIAQIVVFLTYFISLNFYLNLQVAFISSLFVMIGSFYSYKKMILKKVESKNYVENRDQLDVIDDPHDLYSESPSDENMIEDIDLKQIVKEEKAKIKTFNFKSMKDGASAGFSFFRIAAYLFLVLGFISLENNNIMEISIYLPALLFGIIIGYFSSRELFS